MLLPGHAWQDTALSGCSSASLSQGCPALQPLQLCQRLHSILLTMCEDQPGRRLPLQSVLEACQIHWEEAAVHPTSANLLVRQLVGLVLGTISEVSVDLCFSTLGPFPGHVRLLKFK